MNESGPYFALKFLINLVGVLLIPAGIIVLVSGDGLWGSVMMAAGVGLIRLRAELEVRDTSGDQFQVLLGTNSGPMAG